MKIPKKKKFIFSTLANFLEYGPYASFAPIADLSNATLSISESSLIAKSRLRPSTVDDDTDSDSDDGSLPEFPHEQLSKYSSFAQPLQRDPKSLYHLQEEGLDLDVLLGSHQNNSTLSRNKYNSNNNISTVTGSDAQDEESNISVSDMMVSNAELMAQLQEMQDQRFKKNNPAQISIEEKRIGKNCFFFIISFHFIPSVFKLSKKRFLFLILFYFVTFVCISMLMIFLIIIHPW